MEPDYRTQQATDVKLGDNIDPANFWMYLASDQKNIDNIGTALCEIDSRGKALTRSELKVGKWVAVRDIRLGGRWYRARVFCVNDYDDGATVTVDVFLIDYGAELLHVRYPRDISHLIDDLDKIEPYAFSFNLNGLVPTKQTCKFTPANPKKKFQPTRLREWAEHAIALSTLLSTYFSRAWIHTEIKDSNEKPKAGRLIIELDKDHLQYYTKYLKVLQRGGYTKHFPIVDVNRALIGDKLAICIESIDTINNNVGITPWLTGYHPPRDKKLNQAQAHQTKDESSEVEDTEQDDVENAMRRLRIVKALDEHLKF